MLCKWEYSVPRNNRSRVISFFCRTGQGLPLTDRLALTSATCWMKREYREDINCMTLS